jgi:hypothetical protein
VVQDSDRTLDPSVRAWMARLLVVRSVGYIEQSVGECLRGHIQEKSGGWMRSFSHSWLERGRNPSPENLLQLLGRFDQALSDEFEVLLQENDEHLRRELSFMVDRRNKIAHGLNEGIRSERAVDLSEVAVTITDWFVLKFNPLR